MKDFYGKIEYQMSEQMAQEILKSKGFNKKNSKDKQTILTQYVNEQFGLLGQCVKVVTT